MSPLVLVKKYPEVAEKVIALELIFLLSFYHILNFFVKKACLIVRAK
jgi:hypothetical protein